MAILICSFFTLSLRGGGGALAAVGLSSASESESDPEEEDDEDADDDDDDEEDEEEDDPERVDFWYAFCFLVGGCFFLSLALSATLSRCAWRNEELAGRPSTSSSCFGSGSGSTTFSCAGGQFVRCASRDA